jgi:peptidoglycan DL-endopeptidase CwlO
VTDVGGPSTRTSGRRSSLERRAWIVSCAVACLALALFPGGRRAGADPLASAKAQAAQLAQQIDAQGEHLAALSERYDEAQLRVTQLAAQIDQTRSQVASAQQQVAAAEANLRQQALDAYMTGGVDSGVATLFSSGSEQSALGQEYRAVAGGNVSGAIDRLHSVETTLARQQSQLQTEEQGANQALAQAATARSGAQAALAAQQDTLSKVKGQISVLVAQQQAAEAASQATAFAARVAAARTTAQSAPGPVVSPVHGPGLLQGAAPPPVPGGAGARAVAAAESQIGVPYVYGGATPGVGFDCSGLTMWAWAQAGIGLSHSAAAQYDETTHVPLSDLQPGDLLFYDEGGVIGHVTMYVGPGEMIQAMDTGTLVQITGLWSAGLVGAGRP